MNGPRPEGRGGRQTSRRKRCPTWLLLLLACGLAVAGCAAPGARPAQSVPASPQQGRDEIASLQQRIEQLREQLGLPRRTDSNLMPTEEQQKQQQQQQAESPPPPPSPPVEERSDAAPESVSSADGASSDRCRYTRAICHAAERICHIADYLDDDDARGRCQRARGDCREARQISGC